MPRYLIVFRSLAFSSAFLSIFFIICFVFIHLDSSGQSAEKFIGKWSGQKIEISERGDSTKSELILNIKSHSADGKKLFGTFYESSNPNIVVPLEADYEYSTDILGIAVNRMQLKRSFDIKEASEGNTELKLREPEGRDGTSLITGAFYAKNPKVYTVKRGTTTIVAARRTEYVFRNNTSKPVLANSVEISNTPPAALNPKNIDQKRGQLMKLSANPVLVDAEKLYGFSNGYAVIQKGSSYALIDKTGKIVIPYNKYDYTYTDSKPPYVNFPGARQNYSNWSPESYGFVNGFIGVQDPKTKLYGFLNTKLELVVPCIYSYIYSYDEDGHVYAGRNGANGSVILDRAGKVILTGSQVERFYKPFVEVHVLGQRSKYALVDINGRAVSAAEFHYVMPFYEGLAAVAKPDEFGILKWGFIDRKGKTVIPFMYKVQPGIFSGGRALVTPSENTEFDYAYIDKSGKIVSKLKSGDGCKFYRRTFTKMDVMLNENASWDRSAFINGYAIWHRSCNRSGDKENTGTVIMDTTGNFRSYISLLQKNGWQSDHFNAQSEFRNNEAIISIDYGGTYKTIKAIANIHGEIIVTSSNEEGQVSAFIYTLFEPVSGLARVSLNENTQSPIHGYMDRSGEIKIILAPKKIW